MKGLALRIAGVEAEARPSGALLIAAGAVLVVADAHFEKGSAFAARGQLLPPYDTAETLTRLEAEAEATEARMIVFLGDALHDREAEARLAPGAAARIAALARGRTLVWIAGNHDRDAPRDLPGETAVSLTVGGLALVHEPASAPAPGEVAGHLHPCAKVAGAGGRRRCFVTDGARILLPAFGAYAGGLNARDPAIGSLFGRSRLAAVIARTSVHPIPWRSLRGD